jgi:hypothetical protein
VDVKVRGGKEGVYGKKREMDFRKVHKIYYKLNSCLNRTGKK